MLNSDGISGIDFGSSRGRGGGSIVKFWEEICISKQYLSPKSQISRANISMLHGKMPAVRTFSLGDISNALAWDSIEFRAGDMQFYNINIHKITSFLGGGTFRCSGGECPSRVTSWIHHCPHGPAAHFVSGVLRLWFPTQNWFSCCVLSPFKVFGNISCYTLYIHFV